MSNVEPDGEEDKPLDPAMENVRRKMVRLQLVSGSVMFLSFMAVLGAVVYKASNSGPEVVTAPTSLAIPAEAPLAATAQLPAGFVIDQVSLSGGQILFYGRTGEGARRAMVFDITAGRMIADVAIAE